MGNFLNRNIKEKETYMKYDEKIIAEKMVGLEPIMKQDISSKTDTNLVKCLNWYSYMSDEKNCMTWISDYMKKNGYDKQAISHIISSPYNAQKKTLSYLCRMSSNGTVFSGDLNNVISDKINQILKTHVYQEVTAIPVENVISIQDRIRSIAERHMTVLDEIIEVWYKDQKSKIEFSLYDYIQKEQLNSYICNHLKTMIKKSYLDEFEEMLEGKDECLNEGYAFLSKIRKKQIYLALTNLISDIDRHVGNVKTSKPRNPRKKKPVSVEKQINNLKYQKEFSKLKIKSIDPQNIVGAQQLWIFNTKTNQLTMFNALGPSGFSIKGTTIQNFDPDISIKKKLRKPNETIKKVLDGGKLVLKKIMSELTTKPIEVNGRLNDDTIILRSIR